MWAFAWVATLLVVLLVVTFVAYLVSLRRLPTAERTRVPVYDRLGRQIRTTRLGN